METMVAQQENSESSSNSRKRFGVLSSVETVEKPIKQYLYFAFRRSLRDAEAYENAVSSMQAGDERSVFFREMASRKRDEAEKLYSYYKSDGYRIVKDLKGRSIISHPDYEAPACASEIASIEDTYSFAYKKEQNNLDLYSKLAGLDSNPYTKILFDYLANLQSAHIAFIEKKFSLVDLRVHSGQRMVAFS